MKKKIVIILPIILSLFSCNNNRTVNLTINSGAGAFGNRQIEMTYQVPVGSRLSDLSVNLPRTFFDIGGMEDIPAALPVKWQIENKVVDYDYVINRDTTITALYFHSIEEAKSFCYGDMLEHYFNAFPEASHTWDAEIINSFAQIEPFINAAENEYQLLAISSATVSGDMEACKRLAMNNKGYVFNTLGALRQAVYLTELKANNQLSFGISRVFAALFDAIGETFNPNAKKEVEWLNGFIDSMIRCTESLPAVCYYGLLACGQGYIGSVKRRMLIGSDDALPKLSALFEIYVDGFMRCKLPNQAASIGKFGAAVMDAAGENYPNKFDEFVALSKQKIEAVLREGDNL